MFFLSLLPVVYSVWALVVVASNGDIGLTCVLGTIVREEVPGQYRWIPERPEVGDQLISIGDRPIDHYPDYVASLRSIRDRVGREVQVVWSKARGGPPISARATIQLRPSGAYFWSLLWFFQEMAILLLGAYVYWKRPGDESAGLFFGLCIVTVGAYMGGYHWTEIVVEPALIYGFAAFAALVPIVSLHFYLAFPRPKAFFERNRRAAWAVLYGVPAAFVGAIWWCMYRAGRLRDARGPEADRALEVTIGWIKGLAIGYIGLSVVVFGLCIACLVASYRSATNRAERNQAYWILLASFLSVFPISYLLWSAWLDPARLGQNSAAWPMYVVSLLYTVAYALSITRYKLMHVEEIYNRGKLYVLVSLAAGLFYPVMLVVTTLLIGDQVMAEHTTRGGVVAALVIGFLILSGATRGPFQRVIDRRFYREKYKFDEAMQKMNLAVGRLVDRGTLGRRLLEAAAEILRLEWGAIYLADDPRGPLKLAAWHGPEPDEASLSIDNALVERLRRTPTLRVPHSLGLSGSADPATDTMIALGGEVAKALEADGALVGLMVLGPKRSGLPYEDEEVAFLGALSSVAMLALHSADIQQTLEKLNLDLRDKLVKIAEQQRRILLLQEQLTERGQGASGRLELAEAVDSVVFEEIRGSGKEHQRMLAVARKVSASHSAVLIRGESGTGKELLAQAIHAAGPRADGPFVQVHCAALSQSLLESELFGHVKSAFTGADRDRVGRFEQADGGTLFLDEIGDINLEVQTKLLRVLQEKAFERVGSSQTITVNVRIVAATHQDLEALIRAGKFRGDLYYRLNVIPIRAPSLRERKEDIFELAVHFLGRHAERNGRPVGSIEDEAVEALLAYDWPGNIRELENTIERAVVMADGPALTLDDLPPEIRNPGRRRVRPALAAPGAVRALGGRPSPLAIEGPAADESSGDPEADAFERHRLIDALEEARGEQERGGSPAGDPPEHVLQQAEEIRAGRSGLIGMVRVGSRGGRSRRGRPKGPAGGAGALRPRTGRFTWGLRRAGWRPGRRSWGPRRRASRAPWHPWRAPCRPWRAPCRPWAPSTPSRAPCRRP